MQRGHCFFQWLCIPTAVFCFLFIKATFQTSWTSVTLLIWCRRRNVTLFLNTEEEIFIRIIALTWRYNVNYKGNARKGNERKGKEKWGILEPLRKLPLIEACHEIQGSW